MQVFIQFVRVVDLAIGFGETVFPKSVVSVFVDGEVVSSGSEDGLFGVRYLEVVAVAREVGL